MKHGWIRFMAVGLLIPLMSTAGYAQDTENSDELMQRMREMEARYQAEMGTLKAQLGARREAQPQEVEQMIDELAEEVDELRDELDLSRPGTSRFLVTGYAYAGFTDTEGGDSSFDARVFPIFLWKLSDQIFFETELEVELESDDSTKLVLEFMDINFVVNDYLTLRAGKFLSPLSNFKEQLHSAWINKLPDQPLFATGGVRLIPTSSLGVMARGAFPIGDRTFTYSAWIVNGFKLKTTGGDAGELSFKNYSDINNNKSLGGRIGFFPITDLELFYAVEFGDVAATGSGFGDVDAVVHDIGLSYVTESDRLGGRLDVRFEYVLSDVDDVDFGTGSFENEREGGYAQVAYRPTSSTSFVKDLEGVIRYDFIDQPSAGPTPYDEERWTIGVNYWLSSSTVVKLAYRFDDVDDPTGAKLSSDALMAQFAIGF